MCLCVVYIKQNVRNITSFAPQSLCAEDLTLLVNGSVFCEIKSCSHGSETEVMEGRQWKRRERRRRETVQT